MASSQLPRIGGEREIVPPLDYLAVIFLPVVLMVLLAISVFSSNAATFTQAESTRLECYANNSRSTVVAPGDQIVYTVKVPAGMNALFGTFRVDRRWGNFSPLQDYNWSMENGLTQTSQAGVKFSLRVSGSLGGVYQECTMIVQFLELGESGIAQSSSEPTSYTEDGKCARTVRVSGTQVDHLYQCSLTAQETEIVSFLRGVMWKALEGQGLAQVNMLAGLESLLASGNSDVSASIGGNNLARSLRAASGFSSFVNARAVVVSPSTNAFLNCSGTVSTGAGSCAIVFQHSDSVTLKSVTIQTGAMTIAAAGTPPQLVETQASQLESLTQGGLLPNLAIPPPPLPW